ATLRTTALIAIAIAAMALRVIAFPDGHAPPASDEAGYLGDGLLLLEGMVPAYKFVPAGLLTWFTALVAGVETLWRLLFSSAAFAGMPAMLKPLAALEATLFANYADLATLRVITIVAIVVV